jgi:hypothetical protein
MRADPQDRERLALASLTGLLANPTLELDDLVHGALEFQDAVSRRHHRLAQAQPFVEAAFALADAILAKRQER